MFRLLQGSKQVSKINVLNLNKHVLKKWNNNYSSLLGNIFLNAPIGFDKYNRKNSDNKEGATPESDRNKSGSTNAKTNNTNSSYTKQSNNFKSEQKVGGSGGGGGGKKPNGNGYNLSYPYFLIPSGALLLMILLSDFREGREISWQDFQTQLLEGGHVDRIIVTNKNIARFDH